MRKNDGQGEMLESFSIRRAEVKVRQEEKYEVAERDVMSENIVDTYVGVRIRQRRIALKMSTAGLGNALGLAESDVENFELGKFRAGPWILEFADALNVKPSYFFSALLEARQSGSI